jgi:hypothetical protein
MAESNQATVVGVFSDRAQAERVVEALHRAGFRKEEIGVVTRHDSATEAGTGPSPIGTVVGGVTGTVTGGVLAGILGSVVAVAVPGIGPLLLAGVLATIVTGSAIAGALIGMGVTEEEARHYEEQVKAGRTLVVVKADARIAEAWDLLLKHGAQGMAARREHVGTA